MQKSREVKFQFTRAAPHNFDLSVRDYFLIRGFSSSTQFSLYILSFAVLN